MNSALEAIGEAMSSQLLHYPSRLIKKGERNAETVKAVQIRLDELGCGPIDVDGGFGDQTERAIRIFQIKFTDVDGLPGVCLLCIGAFKKPLTTCVYPIQ